MTETWSHKKISHKREDNDRMTVVEEYVANGLGAPFGIILRNAVKQEVCPSTKKVLATYIPNQTDLLKEVALTRALCDRKLSGLELKFLRKAIGLKAVALAELLGISAEHLSRCENGERVLSNSAEKLFRVIILKRRYDRLEIADKLIERLSESDVDQTKVARLRDILAYYRECVKDLEKAIFESRVQSVFDLDDKLCFSFGLRPLPDGERDPAEDDQWRRCTLAEAA